MLKSVFIIFSLLAANTMAPAPEQEVFAGTTPCGQLIRPVHNISSGTDCALVEWELTLLRDPVTRQPATYRLTAYSRHILPDNSYSRPAVKNESAGKWNIVQSNGAHAHSVIYQLVPGHPAPTLRFVKLGDNLLHLLDEKDQYMTGDPFQSYTLNRTK